MFPQNTLTRCKQRISHLHPFGGSVSRAQPAHSGLTLQPRGLCSPHCFLPSYSSPRFSVDSPGKCRDSGNSATRSSRLPGEPVVGQSTTQWAPASPTSPTTGLVSPEVPETRGRVQTTVEQRQSYAQALPDAEPEQAYCSTRTWLIQSSHHFSRGLGSGGVGGCEPTSACHCICRLGNATLELVSPGRGHAAS